MIYDTNAMNNKQECHHDQINSANDQKTVRIIVAISSDTMLNVKRNEKRKKNRYNPHQNINIMWKTLRLNLGKNKREHMLFNHRSSQLTQSFFSYFHLIVIMRNLTIQTHALNIWASIFGSVQTHTYNTHIQSNNLCQ